MLTLIYCTIYICVWIMVLKSGTYNSWLYKVEIQNIERYFMIEVLIVAFVLFIKLMTKLSIKNDKKWSIFCYLKIDVLLNQQLKIVIHFILIVRKSIIFI